MNFRRASNNTAVRLGKELGRGGEGAVSLVEGAPELVAKVYSKPPSAARIDKLRGMARSASPDLLKVAAWPMDLLLDEGAQPRGFLMRRVSGRHDLHELYNPRSRRKLFPSADFRFIVRVAANLARAVAQVHERGHVIGDLNHGNALVGSDGTVRLIDCDSFQIRDGGRVFTCDVGVPLFTPPELSGRAFRGLRRQADHDGFGLAVLLFHLLYLGRHPYAGRYAQGEMSIERAIAEGRFAYGKSAARMEMTAPPGTIPLESFGAEIEALLEAAFAAPPVPRPTAVHWVAALKKLESQLVTCRADVTHQHPEDKVCCWCAHEKHWNSRLFARPLSQFVAAGVTKVARLWDAISAVRRPKREFPLELAPEVEGPPAFELFYALVKPLREDSAKNREELIVRRRQELNRHLRIWNEWVAEDHVGPFYLELERAKNRLLELPRERQVRIDAGEGNLEALQRDVWLTRHAISDARIPFMRAAEVALLASYGFDSADDVLRRPDGLPPSLGEFARSHLGMWAEDVQRAFVSGGSPGGAELLIQRIDEDVSNEQAKLMRILAKGASRLRGLINEKEKKRLHLLRQIDEARKQLRLAETE